MVILANPPDTDPNEVNFYPTRLELEVEIGSRKKYPKQIRMGIDNDMPRSKRDPKQPNLNPPFKTIII